MRQRGQRNWFSGMLVTGLFAAAVMNVPADAFDARQTAEGVWGAVSYREDHGLPMKKAALG